jgi:hypothetical protein
MARAVTADVLAEKVEEGYLNENEVEELMERILHLNGKALFSKAVGDVVPGSNPV